MANIHRIIGLTSVLFVLSACGGGSSGGGGSATKYLVGGVASGIIGQNLGIVLRLNGGDPIQISSDGEFSFTQPLPAGSTYQARFTVDYVFEDQQKRCALLNSDGTVSADSNSILNLRCVPAALRPLADFSADGLKVNWTDIGAPRYNVFAMPLGISDVKNYSAYPGAEMAPNVTSPLLAIQSFSLGARSFVVEAVFADGHSFQSKAHDDINATPLGGILPESILLTREESPYRNYSLVQVGTDITMELGPGAEYVGSLEADSRAAVAIYEGRVTASGTLEEPVKIQNVNVESIYGIPTTTGEIDLDYAWVKGGVIGGNARRLAIKNSYLEDTSITFLSGDMGSAPTEEGALMIERNILNENHMEIRECNGSIRNNVFIKPQFTPMISVWAGNVAGLVFRYNSFLGTDSFSEHGPYVIELGNLVGDVDARENFWDTTDVTLIPSYISDGNDTVAPGGIVSFDPILMEPHPLTPIFP